MLRPLDEQRTSDGLVPPNACETLAGWCAYDEWCVNNRGMQSLHWNRTQHNLFH